MDIPPELKLQVLLHLEKKDVKAVRLVNKKWSICTPSFLFDRIYWSPHDLDREVFRNIVEDKELAGCVKELIFDGSQFGIGLTKERYFLDLLLQVMDLFEHHRHNKDPPLASDDPDINRLVNAMRYSKIVETSSEKCRKLFARYGECKVVNEGYQIWRSLAQKQQQGIHGPRMMQNFSSALLNLTQIRAVTLSPVWSTSVSIREECLHHPNLPMAYVKGSPLARSWKLFHTVPSSWAFEPDEEYKRSGISNGIPEFKFLSIALSRANIRPSKLTIGKSNNVGINGGIAPLFNSSNGCLAMQMTFDHVYRELSHLTIHFATNIVLEDPLICTDMSGLGRLLISLTGLESLFFDLPSGLYIPEILYSYNQVFAGQHGHWPKLRKLTIYNIAIGIKDLTKLLTLDLPKLQDLEIFQIILLDGRWEWIIEYMRKFLELEKLHNLHNSGLVYPDWSFYLQGTMSDNHRFTPDYQIVSDKITNYVIHGGRHPSLLSHQPDAASEGYMEELREFLASEA